MKSNKLRRLNGIELNTLADMLEKLEDNTVYETGIGKISGGFASAEYFDCDDETIDVELKWGVQSDCENTVHTEQFRIDRQTMKWGD